MLVIITIGWSGLLYAQFGLKRIDVSAAFSRTAIIQSTINQEIGSPNTMDRNVSGAPIGIRFTVSEDNYGLAMHFGGFFQPIFAGSESFTYFIQPGTMGQGIVEQSLWNIGLMAEVSYRIEKVIPGLYAGVGISGNRITQKTTYTPGFYWPSDGIFQVSELDSGDFKTGVHFLIGYPIHPRVDIDIRYDVINDFNQVKIGVAFALWTYE